MEGIIGLALRGFTPELTFISPSKMAEELEAQETIRRRYLLRQHGLIAVPFEYGYLDERAPGFRDAHCVPRLH